MTTRRAAAISAGTKWRRCDGSIGKIDEATYEVGKSFIIVDTGPWIFHHKVMLPAGVVERVDEADEKVWVNRTKEQIKDSPEYAVRSRMPGPAGSALRLGGRPLFGPARAHARRDAREPRRCQFMRCALVPSAGRRAERLGPVTVAVATNPSRRRIGADDWYCACTASPCSPRVIASSQRARTRAR